MSAPVFVAVRTGITVLGSGGVEQVPIPGFRSWHVRLNWLASSKADYLADRGRGFWGWVTHHRSADADLAWRIDAQQPAQARE